MKRSFIFGKALFFSLALLIALPQVSLSAADKTEPDGGYIVDQNFDGLVTGASKGTGFSVAVSNNYGTAGVISVAEDGDNKYLKYEKTCEGGGQIPCYTDLSVKNGALTLGDDFVISFDFKYSGTLYDCTLVQGRKHDGKSLQMQDYLFVDNGNIVDSEGKLVIIKPKAGKWYSIALSVHETKRNYDVYVDGDWVFNSVFRNEKALAELDYTCIRCLNITGMASTGTVGMDNLKIYNAKDPILPEKPETPEKPPEENPQTPKNDNKTKNDGNRFVKFQPVFTAKEPIKNKTEDKAVISFNETGNDKIVMICVSAEALAAIIGCFILKKVR